MTFLLDLISPDTPALSISFCSPLVLFRTWTTHFDIKPILTAAKANKLFTTARAWRGFVIVPWEPLVSANADEEISQYARNRTSTYVESLD